MFFMFSACGFDIDSRCLDIAMPKHICKLGDIRFDLVEASRKQMPQIMWIYLSIVFGCFPVDTAFP